MAVDQGYSAAAQVTQSFAITAPPRKLYYVHADHLGTPRAITDSTTNTKVWEWGNEDAFGNNLPNEDPLNTGVATKYNLRFPGQYYDLETNTHYNYFRDYDPGTGRYVQSDPIGLNGGFSTYAYVGGRPVASIDPLGWLEKCRKIIEDEWRKIARGEKIVDYKSLGLANDLLGALINAATTINPGMSAGMKIPIYQDVQLNRLFKVTVEVCVDDCTGKETARRKLREKGIDQYQEVFFNGTREGAPDYAGPDPSFETRWGYGKLPRS